MATLELCACHQIKNVTASKILKQHGLKVRAVREKIPSWWKSKKGLDYIFLNIIDTEQLETGEMFCLVTKVLSTLECNIDFLK